MDKGGAAAFYARLFVIFDGFQFYSGPECSADGNYVQGTMIVVERSAP
jgi:hypothetical protein